MKELIKNLICEWWLKSLGEQLPDHSVGLAEGQCFVSIGAFSVDVFVVISTDFTPAIPYLIVNFHDGEVELTHLLRYGGLTSQEPRLLNPNDPDFSVKFMTQLTACVQDAAEQLTWLKSCGLSRLA